VDLNTKLFLLCMGLNGALWLVGCLALHYRGQLINERRKRGGKESEHD